MKYRIGKPAVMRKIKGRGPDIGRHDEGKHRHRDNGQGVKFGVPREYADPKEQK